jgi:cytoskeletal protein CcmA (bactofilin family)
MARVEDIVLTADEQLIGSRIGATRVRAGHTNLVGDLSGSVHVDAGATLHIDARGHHTGSLHVAGHCVIDGDQTGSVHVAPGGRLQINSIGRIAGSIHNDGVVANEGARAGGTHGIPIIDGPFARVIPPTGRTKYGFTYSLPPR